MGAQSVLLRRYDRRSLGMRSARLRLSHALAKLRRIVIAELVILVAAAIAGLVVGGIAFEGVMLTWLAMVIAAIGLAAFPRFSMPTRETLARVELHGLVGRTQLWLESQCRQLPRPAAQLVDRIGTQLDALGVQLEGLDDRQPAATEARKLVGEHLPEVVSAYTAIPPHLRREARGGVTPDAQLAESLSRLSGEIESVTRQLAEGAIDNLAIRTRYLGYRYGDGVEPEAHGQTKENADAR